LHRLVLDRDDRRRLRDREREPIDDLRHDLASHATCCGRASSPYTTICGTVCPGRAGAIAKSGGITMSMSSSVRRNFVKA